MHIQNDCTPKSEYQPTPGEVSRDDLKSGNKELSAEEQKKVEELKEIDRKVRAHERAHLNNAQGLNVSGASYEYQKGPDGKNYAVAGEVKIDVSKESDPHKTIEKAKKIIRCALAPNDPSPQDRQVAAKARQMENEAKMELMKEKLDQKQEDEKNPHTSNERPEAGIYNQSFVPIEPVVDLYG